MKFIYPAVFRKTDRGTYKGFFRIWLNATVKVKLWMKL